MNLYPPYLGAGVKVTHIGEGYRELHVTMKLSWYNKNIVGTHFGGSIYSMTDPLYMLMIMNILGKEYYVWDRAADIQFIKASKKKLRAFFKLSKLDIAKIIAATAAGKKHFVSFPVDVIDSDNALIAKVNKTLYIRKKRPKPLM